MAGLSLSTAAAVLNEVYRPALEEQVRATSFLLAQLPPREPVFGPFLSQTLEVVLEDVRESVWGAVDEYWSMLEPPYTADPEVPAPASFVLESRGHRFRVSVEPA